MRAPDNLTTAASRTAPSSLVAARPARRRALIVDINEALQR
jgi:hypothetical protein